MYIFEGFEVSKYIWYFSRICSIKESLRSLLWWHLIYFLICRMILETKVNEENERIHVISKKFSFLSRYIQGITFTASKESYNFSFNYSKSSSIWMEHFWVKFSKKFDNFSLYIIRLIIREPSTRMKQKINPPKKFFYDPLIHW